MNIFQYVKDRVSILDTISRYVDLTSRGRDVKGLCPFHSEKTPSFSVNDEQGFYHCFGCGESGDVIKFIEKKENLDPIDAVRYLAERNGIDISDFEKNFKSINQKSLDILRDAALFFMNSLKQNTKAAEYLSGRGIGSDIIIRYGIGFAPDSWDSLRRNLSKNYSDWEMMESGLIIRNKDGSGFYDRFRNRVIFPIIDQRKRVVGFGGRVLGDEIPKYLNSSESDIFKKSEILYGLNIAKDNLLKPRQLIVTEGYMDVISLGSYGIKNVVGTLGTAFTKSHTSLLERYADEIVICFDSDRAGQKAALKSLDVLKNSRLKVRVCMLGEGLDPDDFITKHGAQEFRKKIDEAKPAVIFRIDQMTFGYNLEDVYTRNDFLKAACDLVKRQPDVLDRSLYADYIIQTFDCDSATIKSRCRVDGAARIRGGSSPARSGRVRKTNLKTEQEIEEKLISKFLNINSEEKLQLLPKLLQLDLTEQAHKMIFLLIDYFEKYSGKIDFSVLADMGGSKIAIEAERVYNIRGSEEDCEEMLLIKHALARVNSKLDILQRSSDSESLHQISELIEVKQKLIENIKKVQTERSI